MAKAGVFFMGEIPYDREKAIAYADQWALKRNPSYLDFSNLGGDCTNFASQCLFAGVGVMNYTPTTGWYYTDAKHRAPAWTGARYFHKFLLGNKGLGPYAAEISSDAIVPGDMIQLMNAQGVYYHSLFVLSVTDTDIYIAAHTNDSYMRPLSTYEYYAASYLRIFGARA